MVAQSTATWLFLTSSASVADTAAARAPILTRSMPIVTSSRVPVITPASSDGNAASCRPLRSTLSARSPNSVPQSVPRPPNTDVPPSTTAVMASSS